MKILVNKEANIAAISFGSIPEDVINDSDESLTYWMNQYPVREFVSDVVFEADEDLIEHTHSFRRICL